MDTATTPTADRPPTPRRWIPLSLRMFATIIAFLGSGSLLWISVPAYRQYAAMREIKRIGGRVHISQEVGPKWLRDLVGREAMECTFDEIDRVLLDGTDATDASLRRLDGLPQLRWVQLGSTGVSNVGMSHLSGLPMLETLILNETKLTDDGLLHLKGLKNIRDLNLCGTSITDAGLEHLKVLPNLQVLGLYSTPVTRNAARELKLAYPNLRIGVD